MALDAVLLKDDAWLTDPLGAKPEERWSRWSEWLTGERNQEQADARRGKASESW